MSILKRAAYNWFGTAAPVQRDPGIFWDRGGAESFTGIAVSHEMAMTYSAVYAAVRLISHGMSSLPVGSFVSFGPQTFTRPKPPWMTAPNPETEWPSFIQQVMASILLGGDSFSAKVYARGSLREMWPLDPRLVVVEREPRTGEKVYQINGRTLTSRDVLHIPGVMLPGALRGLSPVEYMRQTIGLGLGAEKHGAKQLANSATPNVIITMPGKADDDVAKKMADRFDRLHAGLEQVGKTAVLGGGATINTLTMTNDQLQFLETRQFQVTEIARWFGIPPHMLADVTSSTSWGTGIEQMQISFVVFALTPWVKFIEAAFKPLMVDWAREIDTRGNSDWYCKFNLNALMRGDMAARAQFYRELANVGAISPNWVLAKEDENPFVGGDAHYVNTAYAPIGPDGGLILPEPPAAPEPTPPPEPPVVNVNSDSRIMPGAFQTEAGTTIQRGAMHIESQAPIPFPPELLTREAQPRAEPVTVHTGDVHEHTHVTQAAPVPVRVEHEVEFIYDPDNPHKIIGKREVDIPEYEQATTEEGES